MRVVYLNVQHLPTDEVDSQNIVKTVSALAANGLDIELLVPRPLQPSRPSRAAMDREIQRYYSARHPIKTRYVPTLPRMWGQHERNLAAVVAALRLRRQRVDFVYVRHFFGFLSACAADLPVVFESHRLLARHFPMRAAVLRRLSQSARLCGVVTNGDLVTRAYRELGFPSDRVLTAHNGFDPADLEPVLTRAEARVALGLDAAARYVFYGGHIKRYKGVEALVEVARRTPQLTYLMAGGSAPADLTWFQRLLDRSQVRNVRLLGWMRGAELVPYMYAADALVIPPTAAALERYGRTIYPMKLYTYLAAGRAVVAPRTPDVADVVRDGHNGLLVQPDDYASAAAALELVTSDRALAERLGQTARREADTYTWGARARRIIPFLEQLAAARGEPVRRVC